MVKKSLFLLLLLFISIPSAYAAPYTDHGNGTITDQGTGLMWQGSDDNVTRAWQGALDYCNGLTLAGQNDWRLPNIKELESIVDDTRYNPSVDPVFTGTKSSSYWSSTSSAVNPEEAWRVFFYDGGVYDNYDGGLYDNSKTYSFYVRCVR